NSGKDASMNETFDCLLSGIEQIFPDMICSVLMLDDDGVSIRPFSSPGLPVEYSNAINGVKIGPNVGSCGTAMYLKDRIIVDDIETNFLWKDFKDLALSFNLRACWSLPIITSKG